MKKALIYDDDLTSIGIMGFDNEDDLEMYDNFLVLTKETIKQLKEAVGKL